MDERRLQLRAQRRLRTGFLVPWSRGALSVTLPMLSSAAPSARRAAQPPGWSEPAARAKDTITMKTDTHPDYHMITVQLTNGTSYQTRSTWGKEGDTLQLDIDPSVHPAWTGGKSSMLDSGGQVARFNKRFGGLSLGKK
jgi:large subunit ribosomal protein L31